MTKHKEIRALIRELTAKGRVQVRAIHDIGQARGLPNDEIYHVVMELTKSGMIYSPKDGYVRWAGND